MNCGERIICLYVYNKEIFDETNVEFNKQYQRIYCKLEIKWLKTAIEEKNWLRL